VTVLAIGLLIITLAGCGGGTHGRSSAGSCVPARLVQSLVAARDRSNTPVRVGSIVRVVLLEPARLLRSGYPRDFPWLTPGANPSGMLVRTPICAHIQVSTLALRETAFRVLRKGKATIEAPLAPPWRDVRGGPRSYSATIRAR
jgi:hypothetical protein